MIRFLDSEGLLSLMKKTIALDSEGDGVKITVEDHHKVFSVRIDSETIVLDSEDNLSVPIDNITITINSEGKLMAAGVEAGDAIELVDSEGDGIKTVNVLFDDVTVTLNEDNELKVPLAETNFIINSEGEIELRAHHMSGLVNVGTIAGWVVNLDYDTTTINSEGKIMSLPQAYPDEYTIYARRHAHEPGVRVPEHAYDLYVPIDSETIIVNSEGNVAVPIDGITIIFNSEGKLSASGVDAGIATELVDSEGDGVKSINVLHDDVTVKVNGDNKLFVPLDNETLVITSEDFVGVNLDNVTLVLGDEGKVIVNIDNDTIFVNSEGFLEADSLPKPVLPETFLHVTSEGIVEWRQSKINGVELVDDKNTEEVKITWFGTQAEYDALPEHNEYTLYIVDSSEGYIPAIPNYLDAKNKPKINHIELTGDKSLETLGIQPTMSSGIATAVIENRVDLKYEPGLLGINSSNALFVDTYSTAQIDNMIGSMRTLKVVSVRPTPLTATANTMYYVATDDPEVYDVYVYDYQKTEIYLGKSDLATYTAGKGIEISATHIISAKTEDMITEDTASLDTVPSTQGLWDFTFNGCSDDNDGKRGIVPTPEAGHTRNFLNAQDGWRDINATGDMGFAAGTATVLDGDAIKVDMPSNWHHSSGAIISFANQISAELPDDVFISIDDNMGRTLSWKVQASDKYGTWCDYQKGWTEQYHMGDTITAVLMGDGQSVGSNAYVIGAKAGGARSRVNTDWTPLTLTSNVKQGTVTYRVIDDIMYINIEGVLLTSASDLNIGQIPTEYVPQILSSAAISALNNNSIAGAVSVSATGTLRMYAKNGNYQYWGTLSYPIKES